MPEPLPLPPESLRVSVGPFADGALFRRSGEAAVRDIVALSGLRPDGQVLEIGCGCGRLAAPLAQYLGPEGRYDGFEVERALAAWCRDNIATVFANFRFQHADVQAGSHNPDGAIAACDFVFPYPKTSFDLVIASSVFTHMLPDAIESYVAQAARVLKPDGRLFMTALLFDLEAAEAVVTGRTIFNFRHAVGPCLTFDRERPEEGIAFPEDWLSGVLGRNGLRIESIRRGNWRTIRAYEVSHDYVVAARAANPG